MQCRERTRAELGQSVIVTKLTIADVCLSELCSFFEFDTETPDNIRIQQTVQEDSKVLEPAPPTQHHNLQQATCSRSDF